VVAAAIASGIGAGLVAAVNLLDLSTVEFVHGLRLFYRFKDVWFGLLKSVSFGFAIALIGCAWGLGVRQGAEEVGRATTKAVVVGAQMILVLDAFWALLLL
jgi:phospholipid/cholesterol/gamma-HCH transport system permease protein